MEYANKMFFSNFLLDSKSLLSQNPILIVAICMKFQSSRTSEAELWFKRALKLAPEDSSVRHHYGEFLLLLKFTSF